MASNAKFCSQCASPLPEPNPPFCSQCGATIVTESNPSTIIDEVSVTADTPLTAILSGFKNYINFSGKATRYDLFWFALVCGLILPVTLHLATEYMEVGSIHKSGGHYWAGEPHYENPVTNVWSQYLMFFQFLTLAYFAGVTIPLFAVFVRRLRNIGKNPKWVLFLAPYWTLIFIAGLTHEHVYFEPLYIPLTISQIFLFLPITYCLIDKSVQDSVLLKLVVVVVATVVWKLCALLILAADFAFLLFGFDVILSEYSYHLVVRAIASNNYMFFLGLIPSLYIYKRKFGSFWD